MVRFADYARSMKCRIYYLAFLGRPNPFLNKKRDYLDYWSYELQR